MTHILAGDAAGDVTSVFESAKRGTAIPWIVPKNANVNDRTLFHLPGHGFAARGVIGSKPRQDRPGRYSATVREITLLSSAVPLAFIRRNHPAWKWPSYPRSYATIDGAVEARLDELLGNYQASFAEPLTEGGSKSTSVTVYERNPIARQQCIAQLWDRIDCHGCGFSFGETYGETAEGYIHVHHLKAISKRGGKNTVDPIKDLRPISPNCHAVIHLQTPPLSILELKRMLKKAK